MLVCTTRLWLQRSSRGKGGAWWESLWFTPRQMKICPSIFRVFVRTARLQIVLVVPQLYHSWCPNAFPRSVCFLRHMKTTFPHQTVHSPGVNSHQDLAGTVNCQSMLCAVYLIYQIYKCFIPPMAKPKQLSCWLILFHSLPTLQNLNFPQYFPHSCASPWIFFRLRVIHSDFVPWTAKFCTDKQTPSLLNPAHGSSGFSTSSFPATTMSVLHVCSGQEN